MKAKRRKKKTDMDKLQEQLKFYTKTPDIHTLKTCETYVQRNIPHLMDEFYSAIIKQNTNKKPN